MEIQNKTSYDLDFKKLNEELEKDFLKYPLETITCEKSNLKNQRDRKSTRLNSSH